MILIEFRQAVVKKHRRTDGLRDIKVDCALRSRTVNLGPVDNPSCPLRQWGRFRWLESCGYFVWNLRHVREYRGTLRAIRVVYFDFLYLPGASCQNRDEWKGPERLTWALAHIRIPPRGANMMPTMKKSGKTLFGVRIGLFEERLRSLVIEYNRNGKHQSSTHCHAFKRCWRKAVSNERRRISMWTDIKRNVDRGRMTEVSALAGLRFLGFLSPSLSLRWRAWSSVSARAASTWDMARSEPALDIEKWIYLNV